MARVGATMSGELLPDLGPLFVPGVNEAATEGLLTPARLSPRWPATLASDRPCDFGDVGIDGGGLFVTRHPSVLLAEADPAIGEAVDRWRAGDREDAPGDYERRSHLEWTLRRWMRAQQGEADKARRAAEAEAKAREGAE